MVFNALDTQAPEGPAALEKLCRVYWKPIYLFIRSRHHSPEQSEDLAQEFFYRLLSKDHLKRVEGPEKGRMRSFLCVLLKRFLADDYDRRMTQKRGGHWQAIPIDGPAAEAQFDQIQSDELSPDLPFDRPWALDLLAPTRKEFAHGAAGEVDDHSHQEGEVQRLPHELNPGVAALVAARRKRRRRRGEKPHADQESASQCAAHDRLRPSTRSAAVRASESALPRNSLRA